MIWLILVCSHLMFFLLGGLHALWLTADEPTQRREDRAMLKRCVSARSRNKRPIPQNFRRGFDPGLHR